MILHYFDNGMWMGMATWKDRWDNLNIIQIGKTLWMVSQRKIYIELNMEDIFNV